MGYLKKRKMYDLCTRCINATISIIPFLNDLDFTLCKNADYSFYRNYEKIEFAGYDYTNDIMYVFYFSHEKDYFYFRIKNQNDNKDVYYRVFYLSEFQKFIESEV